MAPSPPLRRPLSPSVAPSLQRRLPLLLLLAAAVTTPGCRAECWFLEGEREFVWQAICSHNQPPYESIPPHINSTVMDLKLNNNKLRSVQHASLRRLVNLTNLDLTYNAIETIEEGAFSAQRNLQTLHLSFNRVVRLDEGVLRGLARLTHLYLQSNHIEEVSAAALRPCSELVVLDIADNRVTWLDERTFASSSALKTLDLSGNPFHCACSLLPFLRWLHFKQRLWEPRAACEPGGAPLVGGDDRRQERGRGGSAFEQLTDSCSLESQRRPTLSPVPVTPAAAAADGCGGEGCTSADGQDFTAPPEPRSSVKPVDERALPRMIVHSLRATSAAITIHIPNVSSKMYVLVRGNDSAATNIQKLRLADETVRLHDLQPGTSYRYCVATIQSGVQHEMQICTTIRTPARGRGDARSDGRGSGADGGSGASPVRHYIMTTLCCLVGMAFVLGAVYFCLRRRRRHEEQQQSKSATLKKTLADMRQGSQTEAGASYQLLPTKSESGTPTRPLPSAAAAGAAAPLEPDEVKGGDAGDTPRTAKGNYLEVRTGEGEPAEAHDGAKRRVVEERRDSVTEIATIAKEVDKVNRIINNCIDALKSEGGASVSLAGPEPPAGPPIPVVSRVEERAATAPAVSSYKDPYGPAPPKSLLAEQSPHRPGPPAGGRAHCGEPAGYLGPHGGGGDGEPRGVGAAGVAHERGPRVARVPVQRGGSVTSTVSTRLEAQGPDGHRHSYPGPLQQQPPPYTQHQLQQQQLQLQQQKLQQQQQQALALRHGGLRSPSLVPGVALPRAPVMSALGCAVPVPPTVPLPLQQQQQLQQQQLQQYHHQQQQQQAGSGYCQLSPRSQRSGYYSSPEYSAKSVQKIWVRFKPQQQQQLQQQHQPQQPQQHKKLVEEEHMAAGHALKMKVQLATDEDLHDILDFWKGVSAQQKP